MEGQKGVSIAPAKTQDISCGKIDEMAGTSAPAKRPHPTETSYHALNLSSLPRPPGPRAPLPTPLPR